MIDQQKRFEAWAKREGAVNLQPSRELMCEDGRFPATYYYAATETAWRAWANKQDPESPPGESHALILLCREEIEANKNQQTMTTWHDPETPKRILAALKLLSHPEPVAFMWQHDETGNVGFVQASNAEEMALWQKMNRRRRLIGPLYLHPAAPSAADSSTPP